MKRVKKQHFITWFKVKSDETVELLNRKILPREIEGVLKEKGLKDELRSDLRVNIRGKSWSTQRYVFKLSGERMNVYLKQELMIKQPPWKSNPQGSVAYNKAANDPDLLSTAEVAALLNISPAKVRKLFEYSEWHHSYLRKGGKPKAFLYRKRDLLEQMQEQGIVDQFGSEVIAGLQEEHKRLV